MVREIDLATLGILLQKLGRISREVFNNLCPQRVSEQGHSGITNNSSQGKIVEKVGTKKQRGSDDSNEDSFSDTEIIPGSAIIVDGPALFDINSAGALERQ